MNVARKPGHPQQVSSSGRNGTNGLGFEAKLWAAADALRNNMDAAEDKHAVLGLIFLKYISDAFEAKHAELDAQRAQGADPEDPDEYRALRVERRTLIRSAAILGSAEAANLPCIIHVAVQLALH